MIVIIYRIGLFCVIGLGQIFFVLSVFLIVLNYFFCLLLVNISVLGLICVLCLVYWLGLIFVLCLVVWFIFLVFCLVQFMCLVLSLGFMKCWLMCLVVVFG